MFSPTILLKINPQIIILKNWRTGGVCTFDTLLNIYNKIWDGGEFPTEWREATIIPIPESGKDTTNPNNNRPIALTSCILKQLKEWLTAD